MPLLAWRPLGLGLSVVLGSGLIAGCFSEPAAETSGATDSPVDTSATGDDTGTETVDPDSTADPSGGGCMGCLDTEGGCLAGDLDEACGALAAACVACDPDAFCDEGQCAPLPLCNAGNCDGCCDGDDCLDGTEVTACGEDGLECSACPSSSTCNEGSCELPCNSTCDGCCDATGDCIGLDSTDAMACGSQGETCQGCDAGFACSRGSCISTACQADCDGCCDGATCNTGDSDAACGGGGLACQACPMGTSCADACIANDDALWQVHILSATTNAADAKGVPWDPSGPPDPYVEVTVAGVTEATSTANNSTTPLWGEILFDGIPTADFADGLLIELWDSDTLVDDSMGPCSFEIEATEFGVPLQRECTDDSANHLWTLQLAIEVAPA